MSHDLDLSLPPLDALHWDAQGLIPVIAQQADTGQVLMFAWMNREALQLTLTDGVAVYWSRSRGRLWKKGEESGHSQKVLRVATDCDGDVLLLSIEQKGLACHTGRRSCFYHEWRDGRWQVAAPVLSDPKTIYAAKN